MMLEPQDGPVHGMLDLPGFDDGDETVVAPAVVNTGGPVGPSWWRRRGLPIATIVLLVLLLLGGLGTYVILSRITPVTYQTQRIAQGDLILTVSATGPVQATTYDVSFLGTGTIASINVQVGDTVAAGQTLATLNMTSLKDAVNQAQAALSAAQTAAQDAQTNLSNVQAQTQAQVQVALDQMNSACASSSGTGDTTGNPTPTPTATNTPTIGNASACQIATDQYAAAQAQATTQVAQAQQQLDQANSQVTSATAALQTAQDNLGNATLTAPHAGTVAVINGTVGGPPGGAATGNVFIEIVDLTALQVIANVNEADIGSVTTGDPVQFTVSAYGPRLFRGTVTAIAPVGEQASNVVTYPVTIALDATDLTGARLFPGMTATLQVITAQRFQVLLIPAQALAFARSSAHAPHALLTAAQANAALNQAAQMLTDLRNSGVDVSNDDPTPAYVLVHVKSGWEARPVVVGLTDGVRYEVLAGLSAGDTIVVGATGGSYGNAPSGATPAG